MLPWARLLSLALLLASCQRAMPDVLGAAANNPTLVDAVRPGSSGAAVLRAQLLLDRAGFSPGEIGGVYNDNTRKSIQAFQVQHGLEPDGIIGPATWAALNTDTAPAFAIYQITADDLAGPFTKIPPDMMKKAKLPKLNYESLLEALAERFHASPELLARLNPGASFEQAGQAILVPNVGNEAAPQAASILVKRSDCSVTALDAAGKVLAYFPASVGSEHDPLPVGTWKILGIVQNPWFHYNPALFWDADERHAKAKIAPGPNNPVGIVWIALSKEHYGIHGTPEPGLVGRTQSHGCIRLTNWDAAKLAKLVAPGTPAILQD